MIFGNKRLRDSDVNRRGAVPVSIYDKYFLQYARPGHSGECELVIGLDFGTSSSKVVIQAPDLAGRPSYAVDFGKFSHESMPYLLPTKLWVSQKGECSLGPRDGAQLIRDIKLELFLQEESLSSNQGPTRQRFSPEETASCYLALLLRFSRRWFLETKQDFVRHFKRFRWNVNLGVPSPCIEDNEENRIFRRVGKVAWKLSTLAEELITIGRARTELKHVDESEYWETDEEFVCDFEIIPEIAAGTVGYALSDHRREGLHVMLDIGASTVDVCSFKLHAEEGSDRYSLLIADVKHLGTIGLYYSWLDAIKRVYKGHTENLLDKHDPLTPIAEDVEPYLVSREKSIHAIKEAEAEFKKQFLTMVRTVIWQTKLRRAPNDTVWRNGRLPILLIGGGSKQQFFRSAVEELDDWLESQTKNGGTVILTPPIPETLTHSTNKTDGYQFLAVAWGLSHRPLDIGDIIPADSIPDVERPQPVDWIKRYVGKELT